MEYSSPCLSGSGISVRIGFTAYKLTISAPGTTTVGYLGIPQNSQSDDYFTEVGDQGKHIYITASKNVTIDGEIDYPIGTTIDFITAAGATATIAINIQTMYQYITGSTGTRTLAPFGRASAIKVDTTKWYISGIGLT